MKIHYLLHSIVRYLNTQLQLLQVLQGFEKGEEELNEKDETVLIWSIRLYIRMNFGQLQANIEASIHTTPTSETKNFF